MYDNITTTTTKWIIILVVKARHPGEEIFERWNEEWTVPKKVVL